MYLTSIVLAAGSSSRLGQMKQLVPYKGNTLLERQVEMVLPLADHVVCVLGYQAEKIPQINNKKVSYIINSRWRLGLSSSIVAALSELPEQTTHIMLLLSDQWRVTSRDCLQLKDIAKEQNEAIVVAEKSSENKRLFSPPVVIPLGYFEELKSLTGEGGAKTLIQKHMSEVVSIDMPTAFDDLDTPEDLQHYKKQIRKEKELSNDQVKRKWQGSSV